MEFLFLCPQKTKTYIVCFWSSRRSFNFCNADELTGINKLVSCNAVPPFQDRVWKRMIYIIFLWNVLIRKITGCVRKITVHHTPTAKKLPALKKKEKKKKKSELFHFIQPFADRRGEKKSKLFRSSFITAQSENRMRPELTSGMQIRNFWRELIC